MKFQQNLETPPPKQVVFQVLTKIQKNNNSSFQDFKTQKSIWSRGKDFRILESPSCCFENLDLQNSFRKEALSQQRGVATAYPRVDTFKHNSTTVEINNFNQPSHNVWAWYKDASSEALAELFSCMSSLQTVRSRSRYFRQCEGRWGGSLFIYCHPNMLIVIVSHTSWSMEKVQPKLLVLAFLLHVFPLHITNHLFGTNFSRLKDALCFGLQQPVR